VLAAREDKLRSIIALWGIANMVWGALALMAIDTAGFPDGFISDYDRATLVLQTVLSMAILLAGIFMLARSVFGRAGRFDVVIGMAAVLFLYVPGIVIERCPRWSFCANLVADITGHYPNDGIGG